jgi:hypothetical protein
MPTTYNGSAAAITAHEAPAITLALGTDLLSEEGFNVALRKLADYVAYLNSKAALLDQLNALTQTLQLSGGDLELTKATVQALLKAGGGKLQVGTKAGNASDVELLVGGVVKAILRASDGRLGSLLDPVNAQDADTKAARDAAIATHDGVTSPHSATSAATASRLVVRDAAGRAQFADPAAAQDADTKAARDAAIAVLEAALDARVDALEAKESRTAKAWGRIQTGAAGAATVVDGVGIASASWNGTNLTIVLSSAMPDANYCCVHGGGKAGVVFGYNPALSTAGQVVLSQSVSFESGYIYNFAIFN